MVQGADGCTMVTGASDSIGPMTPQPLHFMCSGAVLPLQCFPLGVPTARFLHVCTVYTKARSGDRRGRRLRDGYKFTRIKDVAEWVQGVERFALRGDC